MKKLVMFLACGLMIGNIVFAQKAKGEEEMSANHKTKLGYLNSAELLQAMPEKAKADSDLAKYYKSFQDQLESMGKDYQTKGQAAQAAMTNDKNLSDAKKEVMMKEIQDLQNRIESLQQSAQEKVQAKKQELYQPFLEKADKAIKAVGKERGYDYIFDASNNILYANDNDNVLSYVKAKLGIK